MLNFRTILLASLLLVGVALIMIMLAMLSGIETATAPQLLTATALWIGPGFYAGKRAGDAGILHGMLAGLLGAVLIILQIGLISSLAERSPFIDQLAARGYMIVLILGGLWGSVGGMFADTARVIKARRAQRKRNSE